MGAAHKRQPGDAILDRYMPNATAEEREAARESLRRLARLILRVESRLISEARERAIRAAEKGTVKSDSRLAPPA